MPSKPIKPTKVQYNTCPKCGAKVDVETIGLFDDLRYILRLVTPLKPKKKVRHAK